MCWTIYDALGIDLSGVRAPEAAPAPEAEPEAEVEAVIDLVGDDVEAPVIDDEIRDLRQGLSHCHRHARL